MRNIKDVCKYCVPPKRSPRCHATCPDYILAAEQHEKDREAERKRKAVEWGLHEQRGAAVKRAIGKRTDRNGNRGKEYGGHI